MSIETLEPRIAPASISIAGKTATWTDFDGDMVTMKWTSDFAPNFTTNDRGEGLMVARIGMNPAQHAGVSITITVKPGASGDGRVELGHVDAVDVAFGKWTAPKASISELDFGVPNGVGAASFLSAGIGQTRITDSMFADAMADGKSEIRGTLGSLKIAGDIGYGGLSLGLAPAPYGPITVTGSLRGILPGGDTNLDGNLDVSGRGKSIVIGGSILDGQIFQLSGQFGSLTIGGDVLSTAGSIARVNGGQFDIITVKGSVIGAKMLVFGEKTAKSLFIGGSLVARDGVQESGVIGTFSQNSGIKNITVKGSLFGAQFADWNGALSGQVDSNLGAGAILMKGNVGSINVGGSIYGGSIANSNRAVNGGIQVFGTLGSLRVGGGLFGSDAGPVFILAGGTPAPAAGDFNAIGKISIKSSAIGAYIAAGTQLNNAGVMPLVFVHPSADAGIGSVSIGGNFVNSNIFAGVKDAGILGVNSSDTLEVGDPSRSAKLGPVVIKGFLLSDRASALFAGFSVDVIASITVSGRKVFSAGDGLRSFDTFLSAREL